MDSYVLELKKEIRKIILLDKHIFIPRDYILDVVGTQWSLLALSEPSVWLTWLNERLNSI